jgi:hypothetical protein
MQIGSEIQHGQNHVAVGKSGLQSSAKVISGDHGGASGERDERARQQPASQLSQRQAAHATRLKDSAQSCLGTRRVAHCNQVCTDGLSQGSKPSWSLEGCSFDRAKSKLVGPSPSIEGIVLVAVRCDRGSQLRSRPHSVPVSRRATRSAAPPPDGGCLVLERTRRPADRENKGWILWLILTDSAQGLR